MTREEAIVLASKEHKNSLFSNYGDAFIAGATWADEHPYWRPSTEHPQMDEEVIVLLDDIHCGSNYKVAFGHIVDKTRCIDYNGWNIPDVVCWMPCPNIPYEKEE